MAEKQWERLRKKIVELGFRGDVLRGEQGEPVGVGFRGSNLSYKFVELHKDLEGLLLESGLYSKNDISNFTRRMDKMFLDHLGEVNQAYSEEMAQEWYDGFAYFDAMNEATGFSFAEAPIPSDVRSLVAGRPLGTGTGWFTTNKIVGLDLEAQGTIKNILMTDLFSPDIENPFSSMQAIVLL